MKKDGHDCPDMRDGSRFPGTAKLGSRSAQMAFSWRRALIYFSNNFFIGLDSLNGNIDPDHATGLDSSHPDHLLGIAAASGGAHHLPRPLVILALHRILPPGLPDYTKRSATSLGVALGTVLFRFDWLSRLRPRWFDLPMAIWCLCPMASSIYNALGVYDGIAAAVDYTISYGLPYLIGRVYFTRPEHIRELAIGITVAGMIYVPLCLFEMKMSPHIQQHVYGIDPGGWGEVVYGGYRPKVFMSCTWNWPFG